MYSLQPNATEDQIQNELELKRPASILDDLCPMIDGKDTFIRVINLVITKMMYEL